MVRGKENSRARNVGLAARILMHSHSTKTGYPS